MVEARRYAYWWVLGVTYYGSLLAMILAWPHVEMPPPRPIHLPFVVFFSTAWYAWCAARALVVEVRTYGEGWGR